MELDFGPLLLSLMLATIVTCILLVCMFPLAWVFGRSKRRWVPWVESLFSITLALPPTIVGFYLLIIFSPLSPIGSFLEHSFGIKLVFNYAGLIFASCIASAPFMLSALRNGVLSIPESHIDASRTLGKGRIETIWRVVIPNMKSFILTGIITTFARIMGEFGVVLMIGGSIPGITKVVSIQIFELWDGGKNSGQAHVYAIILVVLSYFIVYFLNRAQRAEIKRAGLDD